MEDEINLSTLKVDQFWSWSHYRLVHSLLHYVIFELLIPQVLYASLQWFLLERSS